MAADIHDEMGSESASEKLIPMKKSNKPKYADVGDDINVLPSKIALSPMADLRR